MKFAKWIAIGLIAVMAVLLLIVFEDDKPDLCRPGGSGSGAVNVDGLARPIARQYAMNSGFQSAGRPDHNGVDFASPRGTPIYAMADGIVIAAADAGVGGFGGWVVISHVIEGQDYSTVYGHSEPGQVRVSTGESVRAGQHIADVGSAGGSTGPHLHFEIHRGNRLSIGYSGVVDPTPWITKIDSGDSAPPEDKDGEKPEDKDTTDSDGGATVPGLDARSTLRARQIIDGGQKLGLSEKVILAALSAGFVESHMKMLASQAVPESLQYDNDGVAPGDYDSLGIFQMRLSIWGPSYGGVEGLMTPEKQIQWFYDQAKIVDNPSLTAGELAANVESPREDLRYKYTERMPQAIATYAALEDISEGALGELAGLSCAGGSSFSGEAGSIVDAAKTQTGLPYVWGGGDANGPTGGLSSGEAGFDCSGLVIFSVAQATNGELILDHSTYLQVKDSRLETVSWEERQPGDLLFFGPVGGETHVSIYSGKQGEQDMQIEAQTFGIPVGEYPVRTSEHIQVRRVNLS